MRYFLDTANLKDIKDSLTWGIFSGVTINPVLMVKETRDYKGHAKSVLNLVPKNWDVSLEVKSGRAEEMIAQSRVLASWDKRIRVKIPTTIEGLKAAAVLLGTIPLNMTIVKSAAQGLMVYGLLAKKSSADMVVSVFCGRMCQAGYDWKEAIRILARLNLGVKILAASIKTPRDISDAIEGGTDIITAPLSVYKMTLSSSLVQEDVDAFDSPFRESGLSITKRARGRR